MCSIIRGSRLESAPPPLRSSGVVHNHINNSILGPGRGEGASSAQPEQEQFFLLDRQHSAPLPARRPSPSSRGSSAEPGPDSARIKITFKRQFNIFVGCPLSKSVFLFKEMYRFSRPKEVQLPPHGHVEEHGAVTIVRHVV